MSSAPPSCPHIRVHLHSPTFSCFFFFNDTATTEIYTLSLHDALPIWKRIPLLALRAAQTRAPMTAETPRPPDPPRLPRDRKSTRLNSSHVRISYAVFCLKKKKNYVIRRRRCQS